MTVQKRLLIWLLALAPAIWLVALVSAYLLARVEIDEFFDTRQLALAAEALSRAPDTVVSPGGSLAGLPGARSGAAEPDELLVAVWSADGHLLTPGGEAARVPFDWAAQGFVERHIGTEDWRIFYLHGGEPERLVAVAQALEERAEMLWQLLGAYLLPLLIALPIMIGGIAIAVHRAFTPLRELTAGIQHRTADDLVPIQADRVPGDVAPLIDALNALFTRIRSAMAYERRLTADASHELRTPIAALKAQWDAWTMAQDAHERELAAHRVGITIDRLSRLVGQLLSLSAIESDNAPHALTRVDWPQVVENAISDVLPILNDQDAEIDVEWPAQGEAMPMRGDNALLSVMMRNLLDNALRYGGRGARVLVRFGTDRLEVLDNGPGMPESVAQRIGERFVRPPGQPQTGSGIGLSIVQRVAGLHQLTIRFGRGVDPGYPGVHITIVRG